MFISSARADISIPPPPVTIGEAVWVTAPVFVPAYSGCGAQTAPVINLSYEQQVLDLVNDVRADIALPPLKLTQELVSSARYHATDMGQDSYFFHDSHDWQGGNLVSVCAWSTRISTFYSGWSSLSENIAAGYSSPASVMAGWMNSTGHKNNILSSSSREIGIGYYEGGGSYYRYWVQNFGRRSSIYPLIINRDQASTDDPNVSLYIYGQGTFTEMRLRNDNGAWGSWQPFQSAINWGLVGPIGDRTVWAELKNSTQTVTTSDSIYITVNASVPTLGSLPKSIHFLYSIPDNTLYNAQAILIPKNIGSDDPLSWTMSSSGSWFDANPNSGTSPAAITITPASFITNTVNTYTGTITITATSPPETLNTPQTIDLILNVVDYSPVFIFLPVILK